MLSLAPSDGPQRAGAQAARPAAEELPGQSWTDTVAPFGTTPASHWAVATVTRTQPCDAGYRGTEPAPWMAYPPVKYNGLSSEPR